MKRSTTENYLRAIFTLSETSPGRRIKSADLAGVLKISRPTVSEALRHLNRNQLINFQPYSPLSLTPKGLFLAQKIIFKHRVIEVFLKDVIRIPPQQIHQQAHLMEHAFSDTAIKNLARFLKNPQKCPHGKNIPNPNFYEPI